MNPKRRVADGEVVSVEKVCYHIDTLAAENEEDWPAARRGERNIDEESGPARRFCTP